MIRVGIGGWTYAPWRGPFYPAGLAQSRELGYASRHVTAIEINGTFYGSQKPESFRRWFAETPDDFVFSLKGPRYTVNRRKLAEAGESVDRFFASGVLELGDKLGPILWQLAPTKQFDAHDIEAFLSLLPREIDGRRIRHVLEVRHESFRTPEFVTLMRRFSVPIVLADSEKHPMIADITGDFVYARLQRAREEEPNGYDDDELADWIAKIAALSSGSVPAGLERAHPDDATNAPRDCFIYFINGAKVRAPLGAQAMIARL